MLRIILLGPPGAGKGTQANDLSTEYRIPKIATGDMLRAAVNEGSQLGREAKTYMDAGQLIPDDVIINLVKQRLSQPDCAPGFLLDGYPRTIEQAQALAKAGITLDHVIEIHVSDEELIKRLTGRRVHPGSGRTYHLEYHPPKVPEQDDVTGERLVQRDDDKAETVLKRLQVYHQQTAPLVEYYQSLSNSSRNARPYYHKIDGSGSVAAVRDRIFKAIETQPR